MIPVKAAAVKGSEPTIQAGRRSVIATPSEGVTVEEVELREIDALLAVDATNRKNRGFDPMAGPVVDSDPSDTGSDELSAMRIADRCRGLTLPQGMHGRGRGGTGDRGVIEQSFEGIEVHGPQQGIPTAGLPVVGGRVS